MENNKKSYDKMLFADWVVKVYNTCSRDCLKPPNTEDENPGSMKEIEKQCATNCIRKYDKGYKLYTSIEQQIFNSYMETT